MAQARERDAVLFPVIFPFSETFSITLFSLQKLNLAGMIRIQVNLRSSMNVTDIGEVSARTGIPPSTLRYYDEIGLISSVGRHGLRRQFAPDVLMQLALVAMGRSAGFSLQEISGMFSVNGTPDLPRSELHQRADALDRQIREMKALSDTLRHVADCPAPSHMECPTFRRLMKVASRRRGPAPGARVGARVGARAGASVGKSR